jgi:exonuclease SbcC
MRPLRLTMQAFGPFAGREVVDFREATSAGLFGVYGPTGAGKSTIFSAMTFALFGEAAKEEQEPVSLRSDYASAGLATEVELVFEVSDRRYVIRRRPEQQRPKKKGNGSTRVPHEAWLFDATGVRLPDITTDAAGKIIAEKKPGAVGHAVEELLGYGPQQFRQIVLLPQGRFEKFLAAKTDERLAILRELFDVSLYRRLAEKMKNDATGIEREVGGKRDVCAQRLAAEAFESSEALKQGLETAQALSVQQAGQEEGAIAVAKKAGEAVSAAEQVEQKFVANEAALAKLASLVGQEREFLESASRNGKVRRAETMLDSEQHLSEAEREFKNATEGDRSATEAASKAEQATGDASAGLAAERARDGDRDRLHTEIQKLDLYRQALAGSAHLATEARQAKEQLAKAAGAFTAGEVSLKRLEASVATSERALDAARAKAVQRATIDAELTKLQAEETAAKAFEQNERALGVEKSNLAGTVAKVDAATLEAATAAQELDTAERKLAHVQALHLSAKLVPGEACPVCGGMDHPSPASGRIEHAGLDESFRRAKEASDRAVATRTEAANALNLVQARMTALEDARANLERPQRSWAEVQSAAAATKKRFLELGASEGLAEAENSLAQARQRRDAAKVALDKLQAAKTSAEAASTEASARLDQALLAIPTGFREMTALTIAIDGAKQRLQASEAALQRALDLAQTAHDTAVRAGMDRESATSRLWTARHRREDLTQRFDTRLRDNGLTREEFPGLKAAVATVAASEVRVKEFHRQLDVARANVQVAEAAIVDVVRPDVIMLRRVRDEADKVAQEATRERARASARFDQLRKLNDEVTAMLDALLKLEDESNALRALAALFNADNELRLDIETFAIGAMFDQVIDAANQRLGPMTSGRFTLEREVDASGGRSRRGLGIRVLDLFTGKARATSTLSGGETFIAALSLALGLSDVVERTNGRVRLDTIFIDEGFGSLDAEDEAGTLDRVLQVLTNLVSQHRSVGLVSHVPLVQEAVPNGFYVRKGLQGSHVEERGIS